MLNELFRYLLCLFALAASAAGQKPEVTLWVIPVENASPNNLARGENIRARVDAFNKTLEGSGVTVVNTVDPVLSMKLVAWNPAFAVPNAAVIMSQQRTLEALKKFALREHVRVRVRFITWDEAFGLIADLNPNARSSAFPDVVQVGTTWIGYLANKDLLLSRPRFGTDLGNWQPVAGLPAAVLPYITDVRLLFYWKRLPSAAGDSNPVSLNSSSWESLIDSIRTNGSEGDTLAMPTGLTLNLLHDYAPLVWSGLGDFVIRDWLGTRVDLSSERALTIPRLLLEKALIEPKPGEPRRLVAFPESSHEEADAIFVNGGYRAIIEPANFIDRWRQDFDTRTITDLLNQFRIPADTDSISRLIALSRASARFVSADDIANVISVHAGQARTAESPVKYLLSVVPDLQKHSAGLNDRRASARRTPVRRFWDYAASAVPPMTFKGGSDLIVLKGTTHPNEAFALADFLATDEDFTGVLAEAGHLPSGRPGYGIDVLLGSMSGNSADPDTESFIRNVQRAIDQGRTYPQVATWPEVVENRQVLEALQNVWRRIAERNAQGLQKAAAQAEWVINSRMNWWYGATDKVSSAWQPVVGILLGAGVVVILLAQKGVRADRARVLAEQALLDADKRTLELEKAKVEAERGRVEAQRQRLEAERSRLLLLHLTRAYRHEAAKFLGDNLSHIVNSAHSESWPVDHLIRVVEDLSIHFQQRLVTHIDEIVDGQFEEMFGDGASLPIDKLSEKAYDGARYIFEAKYLTRSPQVRFVRDHLSDWRLDVYPYAALIALEEWFLNAITHINGFQLRDPIILLSVECGALIVRSSGSMSEEDREVLGLDPQGSDLRKARKGLALIRNIFFYAHSTRVSVEQDVELQQIVLRIPLPLVQLANAAA